MKIFTLPNDCARVILTLGDKIVDESEMDSEKQSIEISVIVERASTLKVAQMRYAALAEAKKVIERERDKAQENGIRL